MAGQCEGHQTAHSCCKSTVRPAQAAVASKASATITHAAALFFAGAPGAVLVPALVTAFRSRLSPIHSPPSAGDSLNSILRV